MLQENYSLKHLNTFGIAAKAKYFAAFSSLEEMRSLLNQNSEKKLLVLGGGSNILLTQDFDGLVLKNEIKGIKLVAEDNESVFIKVGAGENWHEFVMHAVAQNWAGIENLSLIPGTVGAAPMQNIGAYGVEIKEVFESLTALHIESSALESFSKEDCRFGYRESIFKNSHKGQYIILEVVFRLSKKPNINISYGAIVDTLKEMGIDNPSIKDVSDAVISIRQSKLPDPKQIGNAGSFFKNPEIDQNHFEQIRSNFPNIPFYSLPNEQVKIPAGWLIEQAGWKGKRLGEYGVHSKQALVLVNYGSAKGEEIKSLAFDIQASIKEQFGILLQPEVNFI